VLGSCNNWSGGSYTSIQTTYTLDRKQAVLQHCRSYAGYNYADGQLAAVHPTVSG